MQTAERIIARGEWDPASASDHIALDHDERHRRRFRYVAKGGTAFLLNLPRAAVIGHGDAIALADGRLIAVTAAPEPLMAVRAGPGIGLVRLAWHIGNRHLPAEIQADRILLREDHVIRHMLEGLGASVDAVHAPFTPEQGAYAGGGHGHDHHHGDGHHHDHAAPPGQGRHHHHHAH